MPVRKTFTDHSNVLYQQSVMIFVDHRPNFQWRQLCQTMLTCLPGTWSNQHSLQPGACGLCAGASKVIANFGEIFSIYYLFPPGHHQSFAGLLVCVQQRGHHLVSSHLRNSTSVSFDTYINAKRKCFQLAQFLDPRFHAFFTFC